MSKFIYENLKSGKLSFFFLLVVIFLLPLSRELFVIALWPWIIFTIVESIINRWSNWKGLHKGPLTVYLFPGIFFLFIVSLLWTQDLFEGWNHIGRSALMIIFPVLLGFNKSLFKKKDNVQKLQISYVFGVALSLLFLFIYALTFSLSFNNGRIEFNPRISGWEHAFMYKDFSFLIHPTYFGIMVLMAAAICLNEVKKANIFSRKIIWPAVLGVSFLCSVYLISSRTVILASFGVIGIFTLKWIPNRIIRLVSVFTLVLALPIVFSLHPRFNNIRDLMQSGDGTIFARILENTDRGRAWHASVQLVMKHPLLGLGIGDVQDTLTEFYLKNDFFKPTQIHLNCHNQFLEIWLGVGISGFLLISFLMIYPLVRSQYMDKYLYLSFFLIILIGFMFESLLNRLWGVAFITFFYIFLSTKNSA